MKEIPMEKTSLIAWRRREKRFPETEAQRRARARAQIEAGRQQVLEMDILDVASMPFACEGPELDEDEFLGTTDAVELLSPDTLVNGIGTTVHESGATDLRLPLTAEQCQALRALPLVTEPWERNLPPLILKLEAWQEPCGITLRFSLHQEAVPEMIPLKDLCRQLKVGRRAVMRLIRKGELRCYRVGNRYRFSVAEVRNYLDRMASQ
jgi:excisionase family DNA binding protein